MVFLLALIFINTVQVQLISTIEIGTISYWNNEIAYCNGSFDFTANIANYDRIPDNSLAVIHPNYGIVGTDEAHLNEYHKIVDAGVQRGVKFLGYIPTGYGNRDSNSYSSHEKIQGHVEMFFREFPTLAGIFYDEVENPKIASLADCQRARDDFPILRDLVKKSKKDAIIAWNPTWNGIGECYLSKDTVANGELVLNFEQDYMVYMSQKDDPKWKNAKSKAAESGAKIWHVINRVSEPEHMNKVIDQAIEYGADYVYATNTDTGYMLPAYYYNCETKYIASKTGVKRLN